MKAFLCFALSALLLSVAAQPSATSTFRTVDVYVDSGNTPLAAYQVEFRAVNGGVKIVGIEGGEHQAFAQPPFYDPKALQQERAIIAAFSTNAPTALPKGKTRVATMHLLVSPGTEPVLTIELQAAAGASGNRIQADTEAVRRESNR